MRDLFLLFFLLLIGMTSVFAINSENNIDGPHDSVGGLKKKLKSRRYLSCVSHPHFKKELFKQ